MRLFENYRQLEYACLFCQILALMTYILFCKLLKMAKEQFATPAELNRLVKTADPFWRMLIVGGKMDFLRQENFFMRTVTIFFLNIFLSTLGRQAVYQEIDDI